MGREKKELHHEVTGKEWRGDARGRAGLLREAAEVLEEYFSGWGDPTEKCGV